jgi:hypothetical protein
MSSRSSENEVWRRDVPFERLADKQAAVASLRRALIVRCFKVTELSREVVPRPRDSRELIPTGSNIPSQLSGKMLVIGPPQ